MRRSIVLTLWLLPAASHGECGKVANEDIRTKEWCICVILVKKMLQLSLGIAKSIAANLFVIGDLTAGPP